MNQVEPYFGVFWGPREQTFGEFMDQTREFLAGLRAFDPVFEKLYVLGDRANDEKFLGADLEHLETLSMERAWYKKTPKDWYSHLDDSGRPTRETLVDTGWGFDLVTEPEAKRTRDFCHLSISTGIFASALPGSRVLLTVGDPESRLLAPELSERVFRFMIDFWQADSGLLTEESYRDAVWDDDTLEQLGWLNYHSDPTFARFLPRTVSHEPYRDGILFRIGNGRVLNANDRAEVTAGRKIQTAIRKTL